jgi:uncharacterized protein (DUF2141 family)
MFFCFKSLWAQNKIVVSITNFENNKGVCLGCVFANAASFDGKGKPVVCSRVTVANKKAQLIFENLPAGTYAISVFHDANNNQKMDKNFLGIPKEGYGASGNKLPFASAPDFDDNKFQVANNTIINLTIKLRNL